MDLYFFEGRTAGTEHGNWGKFCVGLPGDAEWAWRSRSFDDDPERAHLAQVPLLRLIGWAPNHIWVWDLQTGEGGVFRHGGLARADLEKHQLWVCPLFEPFLQWLYAQPLEAIPRLPQVVELQAEFRFYGHRRAGAWFDRATGELTVLPGGRGMCLMRCAKGRDNRWYSQPR